MKRNYSVGDMVKTPLGKGEVIHIVRKIGCDVSHLVVAVPRKPRLVDAWVSDIDDDDDNLEEEESKKSPFKGVSYVD
jgi:hypothetical protein